jgi:hypothetical protein
MTMTLEEDDIRDAMLFRFWIRGASEFPIDIAKAIMSCLRPDEYRAALKALALSKGINLP